MLFRKQREDKNRLDWETATRRKVAGSSKCNCCWCRDTGIHFDYEILREEVKATQKSIAHCKEDTNKILSKVQKLEAFFQ